MLPRMFLHGIHKPSHGAGYLFHPIIAKYQPLIVHRRASQGGALA